MTTVNINLLPSEIKKKRVAEKGLVIILGALIVVIVLSAVITSVLFLKAENESNLLEAKKGKVNSISKEISKYSVYKKRQDEVLAHKTALDEVMKNEIIW